MSGRPEGWMNILPSKRFLTPGERIAEVLFGLIMVLTFTGSLSVAEAGRAEVRTMLIGALGCNIAWGIIDGLFYLMDCLVQKGETIRVWREFKHAETPEAAYQVITGSGSLPPLIAKILTPVEFEVIRLRLMSLPESPEYPGLQKKEWFAALMVFFWVFSITFPVAVPFLVMHQVRRAMRFSNVIAIALLFASGFAFGRVAEYKPWITGLVMVLVGGALVFLTIALGG
jgi:VIT family